MAASAPGTGGVTATVTRWSTRPVTVMPTTVVHPSASSSRQWSRVTGRSGSVSTPASASRYEMMAEPLSCAEV
ncbi:MAG: hypothetical protein IPK12_18675 [Gemmatimonadetes bacterium]|nr:hypothetical protein [Gemmatimonadota bacterium]